MPAEWHSILGGDRRQSFADWMLSKSWIGNKLLHIFIQVDVAVNLYLDETIEGSTQGTRLRVVKWLRKPVRQLSQQPRHS